MPAQIAQSMVKLAITLGLVMALMFVPAGTWDWPRGWAYLGFFVVAMIIAVIAIWRLNPEIFEARSRIQPGTKSWDYIYIALAIGGLAAVIPVAALDDGRFHWTPVPDWVVWLGYGLSIIAFAGQVWSQAVNRHFEPGIRIQSDRGHKVVDSGPYAIVRHPGYVSGALLAFATALALGSFWALIPAIIAKLALLFRTIAEERVLVAELPGYREYTQRVKYRWVPGVW